MRLLAGIVTYNPEIKFLEKNINAIVEQVEEVIVFDNNSQNITDIERIIDSNKKISILKSSNNMGIAYALNQIMNYGYKNDYDWCLSLDQDSVCPDLFVYDMEKCLEELKNVGILAPTINDRNTGIIGYEFKEKYKDVRNAITSGSITNLKCWNDIGGFDEKMFIDSVDFDFSYRMRKKGYRVIQTSTVILNHAVGEGKKYQFLWMTINNYEHSAFRCYYLAQNRIYYPRKNCDILLLIKGNYKNIRHIFNVIFFEHDKKNKIKAILSGWKNGYKI